MGIRLTTRPGKNDLNHFRLLTAGDRIGK